MLTRCGTRLASYNNILKFARFRNAHSTPPDSPKRARGAPLALDLDGISLHRANDPRLNSKGFTPNPKDLGLTDGRAEQLLSVRLERRLPQSQRTSQFQISTPYLQRPQQNTRQLNPRPSTPRVNPSSPKMTGTNKRQRPPNRSSRPGRGITARTDLSEKSEPDVPLTPAKLPERRYNLTSLSKLVGPTSPTIVDGLGASGPVQRVRERVGGDYSGWVTTEDLAAAGKDDVSTVARARLALAFNPTIHPKDRKKLIDTTQVLLNQGRPSDAVVGS